MNDSDEYKSNKPLIDRIKQAESQVEKIKGRKRLLYSTT